MTDEGVDDTVNQGDDKNGSTEYNERQDTV